MFLYIAAACPRGVSEGFCWTNQELFFLFKNNEKTNKHHDDEEEQEEKVGNGGVTWEQYLTTLHPPQRFNSAPSDGGRRHQLHTLLMWASSGMATSGLCSIKSSDPGGKEPLAKRPLPAVGILDGPGRGGRTREFDIEY